MVIRVYVSGISASQEVRKKQQRILFILESLKVSHEVVDITEPGKEDDRSFMKEKCLKNGKTNQLPPQIFSDEEYLGDYDDFEVATENENLCPFLRLSHLESEVKLNNAANQQSSQDAIIEEALQNEGEPSAEILVNGNLKKDSLERDLEVKEGGQEESEEIVEGKVNEEVADEENDEEEEEEEEEEEDEE